MKPIYLNNWSEGGFEEMVKDFEGIYQQDELASVLESERWQNLEVILASYGTEDYGGDAFVLFKRDGKFYEVNGSHCSCYGLGEQDYSGTRETQWEPEETNIEALKYRLDNGRLGQGYNGNEYAKELREVLSQLKDS